jgi:CBS domain-containing protein
MALELHFTPPALSRNSKSHESRKKRMRKNEPISKVMSSSPISVHEGDPISKVKRIIEEQGIHHVPVVSGEKLIGIISWSDLLRVSFGEFGNQDGRQLDALLDHTYTVTGLMSGNPTSIPVSGTVREAARILSEGNFHALPVVDNEKLVGIVTSTDLIKFLAEL